MSTHDSDPATLIHSVRVVEPDGIRVGWLTVLGGVIDQVGADAPPSTRPAAGLRVIDGRDRLLAAGLIDMHCHGGGGGSLTDPDPESIDAALAVHTAGGSTRTMLSLVSAPLPTLLRQLEDAARLAASRPQILGTHLEGPFLDTAHRGAHDPAVLTTPTDAAVDALLAAGNGTLRQITLAPELPGAIRAIRRFVEAGVVVAVGHTDADDVTCHAAFDAGASVLTHAFNGMRGLHHRDPGPVAAALDHDGVTIEAIADGVHLHPSIIRLLFAAAPGRVALITDAMAAAGHGDGEYRLGGLEVVVRDGVARLAQGGSIAGSTLTQDAALRTAVAAGIGLVDAVSAASAVPAAALGAPGITGRIEPDTTADLVLFDESLAPTDVWRAGVHVFGDS